MGATLGRTITDYRTLVETCRARAVELGLSRAEIDRLSGLPSGYAGKLLGKAAVDDVSYPRKKRTKKMLPVSLEVMLGVLGLKILLIEDDVATARTLALRVPVESSQQRFDNISRISARLLAPPSQPAPQPPVLSIVGGRQKRGCTKYG
jgi:hypothetical protein